MECIDTHLPGLFVLQPKVHEDARGFFMESYSNETFKRLGLNYHWVQDNHSMSRKGVLRGLHFQSRNPQTKLVRVVQGSIFDVAVDLRAGSRTFGQGFGIELSSDNHTMLYIPAGFAHGFCVLSETAQVQYKVDQPYDPTSDCGVIWNDSSLDIKWPLDNPILSSKDQALKTLNQLREEGIV